MQEHWHKQMTHDLMVSLTVRNTQSCEMTRLYVSQEFTVYIPFISFCFLLLCGLGEWKGRLPFCEPLSVFGVFAFGNISPHERFSRHICKQIYCLYHCIPYTNHTWHLCRIQLHLNCLVMNIFVNMKCDTAVSSFHYFLSSQVYLLYKDIAS